MTRQTENDEASETGHRWIVVRTKKVKQPNLFEEGFRLLHPRGQEHVRDKL